MTPLPRVALLVENSRAYGRQLLRGVARYARMHGPWAFYARGLFYRKSASGRNELAQIRQWRPDGVIARDSEPIEQMRAWGIPIIIASAVDNTLTDMYRIITNDQAIGEMAADHLYQRGFRNFAYCGYPEMFWSTHRGDSFRKALIRRDMDVLVYDPPRNRRDWTWQREQTHLAHWVGGLPKPTAIMACNDDRAQQIAEACIIAGRRVPYDVAILGVDDDDQVCDLANPSLTSVRLSVEHAGYTAASILAQLMDGEKLSEVQVVVIDPVSVVRRESTDFLAVEDELVRKGLKYIRSHAPQPLQINDVAAALGVSRRSLHDRFRAVLGFTVHEEIKRARIDLIADLLAHSDLSITQIAEKMGFAGSDHLSRYFKQEMHRTPREFRKLHLNK